MGKGTAKPYEGALVQNKVIVPSKPVSDKLHGKRAYGTMVDGALHLSLLEAYYLAAIEKIVVTKNGVAMTLDELRSTAQEDPEFSIKYPVYKDLRDRTYIVKTGFKYGCHFRVYRKSIEDHAEFLVHVMVHNGSITSDDIIRHVRLAHSVKKTMILALLDEENDINYYSVERETI
jgi:tRNA-intron endonuclease